MTAFVARGEGILDPFPQYIKIPEEEKRNGVKAACLKAAVSDPIYRQ
jgi:hypothetical protein